MFFGHLDLRSCLVGMFENELLVVDLEAAEIVLVVRIVVRVKSSNVLVSSIAGALTLSGKALTVSYPRVASLHREGNALGGSASGYFAQVLRLSRCRPGIHARGRRVTPSICSHWISDRHNPQVRDHLAGCLAKILRYFQERWRRRSRKCRGGRLLGRHSCRRLESPRFDQAGDSARAACRRPFC